MNYLCRRTQLWPKRERVKRMNKQSQIILTAAYCKRYARRVVRGRGTIAEGRLETKNRRGFGKIKSLSVLAPEFDLKHGISSSKSGGGKQGASKT